MLVSAVAVEVRPSCATLAIAGSGERSWATAAYLSACGHSVSLLNGGQQRSGFCEVFKSAYNPAHSSGKVQLALITGDAGKAVKGSDAVLVCAPATEYGSVLSGLAPVLNSGQTIFLVDASLGAALEASHILSSRRNDLSVNIIEMGALFESFEGVRDTVRIKGVRERVTICGRSLNETRIGLSVGGNIWGGLVPASNVLERGFADVEKLLRAAVRLFVIMGVTPAHVGYASDALTPAVKAIINGLELEIQSLARIYNVAAAPLCPIEFSFSGFLDDLKAELGLEIKETVVLLSALGRLAYAPTVLIDAIIEMASAVLQQDLRKEGRQLADLGLIGMDIREVVELVNS